MIGAIVLMPAAAAGQERSIVAVLLNSTPQGDVFIVTTPEGLWMAVADLEAMGLSGFAGQRQSFEGREHVRLSSLAPDLVSVLDEADLLLEITAAPRLFPAATYTAVPSRPPDLQYLRSASSYLNYRMFWSHQGGLLGAADAGVNVAGALFASSGAWDEAGHFRRGLSTLTVDAQQKRVRLEAGDVIARWSGNLAGGALLGGLSIGRENSIDPYYQQYHVPAFSGSTTLPATADLYVNGMLQRSFDLNPGAFRIDGLPVTAGRGDILVRVRDSLGQVQDLRSDYYLSTQLLAAGQHDFRLAAGLKRVDGSGQPRYEDWAFLGGYRVGVTQRLTLAGFAEGDEGTLAGGVGFGVSVPWLGEFGFEGSAGRDRDMATGIAAAGSWDLTTRHVSVSASGRWFDDFYAGLGNSYRDRTQPWSARVSVGVPVGRHGSLAVEGGAQDLIEIVLPESGFELPEIVESRIERAGLRFDFRVLPRVHVRAAAFFNRNLTTAQAYWSGTLGMVISPGRRLSMSVEAVRDDDRQTLLTDINRPLPRSRGAGFRVRTVGPLDGHDTRLQGQVDLQNSIARGSIAYDRDGDGQSSTAAALEGAVVQVGKAFALSRPVSSSFVMVNVPRGRGVTVYRDHDKVGRTDPRGRLLVPDLQSYYGNILTIEDTDLPLDVLVEQTRFVVAPPFRGGAVLRFPTRLIRAYTGTIRLDPWPTAQARYGTVYLRREAVERSSPMGSDGGFYFDSLEPGRYDAEIEMGDQTCRTIIEIPPSDVQATALGEILCRVGEKP